MQHRDYWVKRQHAWMTGQTCLLTHWIRCSVAAEERQPASEQEQAKVAAAAAARWYGLVCIFIIRFSSCIFILYSHYSVNNNKRLICIFKIMANIFLFCICLVFNWKLVDLMLDAGCWFISFVSSSDMNQTDDFTCSCWLPACLPACCHYNN